MNDQIAIRHQAEWPMTTEDEFTLLRAAHARNPDSVLLRRRLVALLIQTDRFEDAIARYDDVDPATLDYGELAALVQALLAVGRADDTERAASLAALCVETATIDRERAVALAARAKALRRLGGVEEAERCLRVALSFDPHNKDACKRLVSILLDRGEPRRVLAEMDALLAQGVGHARLFAARTLALARCGEIAAARMADGWASFAYQGEISTPPGWSDLSAFNVALASELLAHRGLHFERYGTASHDSWRIDAPMTGAVPRVRELLDAILAEIGRYAAALPATNPHPWIAARPQSGALHSGCVITEHTGYESWHMHQIGWLSGVYYAQVPDPVRFSADDRGCIAFGLPEDQAGDAGARDFGVNLVRPQPGTILLFPSHCHHRTFPHGTDERRICVAFDLRPD